MSSKLVDSENKSVRRFENTPGTDAVLNAKAFANTRIDTNNFCTSNSRFALKMCRGKEIVCLVALLLTAFAAIQNKPLKFGTIQQPKPLFAKGSIVQDWAGGQLEMLQMRVSLSDLSLVFFYAPWCAESIFAKDVYENVAQMFHEEVYFAAVNCWQPIGECRLQYSKVNTWPILMAYYKDRAIQYTGPWSLPAIIKFIENLISPLKRIKDVKDLSKLKAENEAVLVGFFQDIKSNMLLLYIKAALQWLEYDPFQNVKFGVVTGSTALKFGINNASSLRLYLWNETMNYAGNKWSAKNITVWVKALIRFNNHWVDLPVKKSSLLTENLKKSPTVLAFVPRDYMFNSHLDYFLIKQAAWEYSSCLNTTRNNFFNYSFIMSQGTDNWKSVHALKEECAAKKILHANTSKDKCHLDIRGKKIEFLNLIEYYTKCRNCCSIFNYIPKIKSDDKRIFIAGRQFDPRDTIGILHMYEEKLCRKIDLLLNMWIQSNLSVPSFHGMRCKHDKPLTFLMMDSLLYHDIIEKLTGRHEKNFKKTTVFILDSEAETTHKMNTKFSSSSFHLFITDFHNRNLKRQQQHKENKSVLTTLDGKKIKIADVDFNTVKNRMEFSKSTLVVLFYSSQCALCTLLSQVLLKIAKLLQPLNITYLRIDGDKYELPWEYTMESYPALILFPRNKTMESRLFPQNIEPNMKNVFGFMLANLSLTERLQALAEFCRTVKISTACRSCISLIRRETLKNIQENLQLWRKVEVLRNDILRRLEILLEAYVILYRIDDGCDMTYFKKSIANLSST